MEPSRRCIPGRIYRATWRSERAPGGFSQRRLIAIEEIWYEPSRDKRKTQGWVVEPPGFDAAKKYQWCCIPLRATAALYPAINWYSFIGTADLGAKVVMTVEEDYRTPISESEQY